MPDGGPSREPGRGPGPSDDLVQPFHLDTDMGGKPRLMGRLSRLGPLVDDVLGRHDYPEPVATLLAEALALTAALAAALKFNGIFTFQIQSKGPVSLLVVDITTKDDGETYEMRGYAKYDEARMAAAGDVRGAALLGEGYLALTVDRGPQSERYQGLVELEGETLAECAQHYFRQSQQMDAAIMLSAARLGGESESDGAWRAGAIMVQRIADDPTPQPSSDDGEDPWRRVMMLMATGTDAEMLDPGLPAEGYLFRLFHEEGVRVTEPRRLARGCRCSVERIEHVLKQFPHEEIADLSIDGAVVVTCEFCSEVYRFDPATLNPL